MAEPARKLMSDDEFLDWCLDQEETWELADGVPVLKDPELMAGVALRHDIVRGNIDAALRQRLKGRCRVFGEGVAVRLRSGRYRRPDVVVDCSPLDPDSLQVIGPSLLVEVLSPGTRSNDMVRKPGEYRELEGLQHFMIVDPRTALCWVWSRDANGIWFDTYARDLADTVELAGLGLSIPMTEIYDGLDVDLAR